MTCFRNNGKKEVERKKGEIKKMFDEFRRDEVMLTDDMKKRRLEEIETKEAEVKDFQRQKFGVNGELFTKRQELMKPIQEKIYKAIKEVAEAGNYSFIFDMANNASILYADPKMNKTEAVMKKLGIN
ncbi:MAG: OmpH family outer membrane protein [Flavobacteriales bacterium]